MPDAPARPNPMPALYRRLQAAGYPEDVVRETGLPEWWDDEIAMTPAGYAAAVAYISRLLWLDYRSLMEPDRPIVAREGPRPTNIDRDTGRVG